MLSCTSVKHGAFFYPSYKDGQTKVLRRDCCGGAGPEEVLVLSAPANVKYLALMRPAENGIVGRMGVYIPAGVKVRFVGDEITLVTTDSKELPYRVEKVMEKDLTALNPKCLNVIGSGLNPDRHGNSILREFEGKGKKGTIVWTDVILPAAPSGQFRILYPEIVIDDQPFKPNPVDFLLRDPDTYVYPLNC